MVQHELQTGGARLRLGGEGTIEPAEVTVVSWMEIGKENEKLTESWYR
jgi:hypothetical protein